MSGRGTCRGSSEILSSKLGKDNRRSMGSFSNSSRLQTGVHSNSSLVRNTQNFSFRRKFRNFSSRSKFTVSKRRCRESSSPTFKNRFLQHIFSGPEKERTDETSYKSQTSQQIPQESTFQNGHFNKSLKPCESRRLGNLNRSDRCLPPCTDFCKTSQISKILCSGSLLSMESPLFRVDVRPSGLYQDCNSCSSFSEITKHKTNSIPGRLVHIKSGQASTISRPSEMPSSPKFTGFSGKQREIKSSSYTEVDLSRGSFSSGQRVSLSDVGKNNEDKSSNQFINKQNRFSQTVSTFVRAYGIMHSADPQCSLVYASNSVTSSFLLETKLTRFDSSGPCYTTSSIPFNMVEKWSKHAERPIFSNITTLSHNNDRCFEHRFRWVYGEPDFSRDLDGSPEKITHKLFRDGSSLFDTQTFSDTSKGENSIDSIGQHNGRSIHQQARGDKISKAVLSNMGPMESGYSEWNNSESSSYYREEKYFGRSAQSYQNQTNRMDFEQESCPDPIQYLGESFNRLVCVGRQLPDGSILFMDPTPESVSPRCSDNLLGQNVCLCLPSDMHDSESSAIYEAIPLSDSSNSPIMAKEALVPRTSTVTNCCTNKATCASGFALSTQNSDLSPRSPSLQLDCMATLNRRFETEGFSEGTRELLSASWRKGTQKDYCSKFKKFNSWCGSREIDPTSISLSQVAEFLTYLFHSGLQYRTIAGYRSMLSNILPLIDNQPVGQHPSICRLIKGIFNSRPPVTKLLPEWDLHIVLRMLEKSPFEPIETIDLKELTFKTVFLIAVTTFRRCSDLQALRTEETAMRVQQKGITFIRQGLAKQDRENHFGSKIFVPAFSENICIDPRRTLLQYLKKTESFRKTLSKDQKGKLFLSLTEAHKPVTSQTISKWIVQTIKQAYNNDTDSDNHKITAHSTRAIGPSWALFKGASLSTILESADWKLQSTFCKYYYRELDVCVLKNLD